MTANGSIRRGAVGGQGQGSGFVPLACLLALATWSGNAVAAWIGESIDLMGTRVSVDLWAEDGRRGNALARQVLDAYRRIDAAMSTYRDASEISLVNARAAQDPVRIGAELYDLIARALELSAASGGAFDITYESVGYLYDFRAATRPTRAEIDSRLDAIDYRHVVLDPLERTIAFGRAGVRINLGGIAKGYAVEHAAAVLRAAGIEHAMLTAGGDTRVIGDRRGRPWIVGIRHPRLAGEVVTRLPLQDEAISTSGDYERYFEDDGQRVHHILNPLTGEPSQGILSATVIGPDATLTDGLSTTVFVLGRQRGLALVESMPGYEAVVVEATGELSYSSGLAPPAN